MRLATVRLASGATQAARIDDDAIVLLNAPDVGALLTDPQWREVAAGDGEALLDEPVFAPVVPAPGKVFCVGLNYRTHITEMGRDLPEYPTLFTKFADALIGPGDDIALPPETDALDFEAELTVVIGETVRRADAETAERAIAGFTVLNDVTTRDWQFRTREWTQGKNWEGTTPVGPWLVTPDDLPGGVRPEVAISCTVDGEVMQSDTTADLLFDPVDLVSYISTIITLRPGDLIATGTPGGVGHARQPAVYLADGQQVLTEIEGIGRLNNRVVAELGP